MFMLRAETMIITIMFTTIQMMREVGLINFSDFADSIIFNFLLAKKKPKIISALSKPTLTQNRTVDATLCGRCANKPAPLIISQIIATAVAFMNVLAIFNLSADKDLRPKNAAANTATASEKPAPSTCKFNKIGFIFLILILLAFNRKSNAIHFLHITRMVYLPLDIQKNAIFRSYEP